MTSPAARSASPSPFETIPDIKADVKQPLPKPPLRPTSAGSSSAVTRGDESDLLSSRWFTENPEKTYERNLQITAFVLAMIALLLAGLGFGSWGLATTRSIMMSGFGFMYQFVGTHLVMLGGGTIVSALVCLMISQCRCAKKTT